VSVPEILTTSAPRAGRGVERLPPSQVAGERMIDMLKRHEIQVLRRAGFTPGRLGRDRLDVLATRTRGDAAEVSWHAAWAIPGRYSEKGCARPAL